MDLTLLIISYGVIGIFFCVQIVSLFALFYYNNEDFETHYELPLVSILLAARNESSTIERCLLALSKLDYPTNKIEVLIGNDASSDNTQQIAEQFIVGLLNFKVYPIHNTLGKALGKANVLAQLAHKAKGDYFFITDCDVAVPRGWIKSLLGSFKTDVGIVSGTTLCYGHSINAILQRVDWLHFMGYIKSFANLGISCTSVGNNMAVRAKAYWQTGGYENMDFSITEDYKLFKEVTLRGWQWRNTLSPDSLGLATPISSLSEFMHQRKRWLMGARELPLLWKTMLIIYGLFFPSILLLAFFEPKLALIICLAKLLIQSLFILSLHLKLQRHMKYWLFILPIYEIYLYTITLCTAIFYLLPIPSVWKERTYNLTGIK